MEISLPCGTQDKLLSGSPLNKLFLVKLDLSAFAFGLMAPLAFGSCAYYLPFMEQDPSHAEHSVVSMECEEAGGKSGGWSIIGEKGEGTKLGSCGASKATLRLLVYGWREKGSQRPKSEM